ncbi:MAG: poly-gamma-glutamate hydrolase family protein [Streptomyces sp.]
MNLSSRATAVDTYKSFAELAAHETEGVDWSREAHRVPESDMVHLAVHGGGIEVGTTEVARGSR